MPSRTAALILAAIALVSCAKDVENCDFPEGRVISNCKLPRIAP